MSETLPVAERRLVWIDTETTGLDPFRFGDRLLEIACRVTDAHGVFVDDGAGWQAVVRHTAEDAARLRACADPVVQAMHDRTGLWGRLPGGETLSSIEDGLLEWIRQYVPNPRQGRLAGNSVALDRKFLEAYLPRVEEWLHYRVVDCSSNRFLLDAAGITGDPLDAGEPEHTAFSDIMGSIREYRWQLGRIDTLGQLKGFAGISTTAEAI